MRLSGSIASPFDLLLSGSTIDKASISFPHTHTPHTPCHPSRSRSLTLLLTLTILHNSQPTSLPLTRYHSPIPTSNPPCCTSRSPWHIQCSLQQETCKHASRFGALHNATPTPVHARTQWRSSALDLHPPTYTPGDQSQSVQHNHLSQSRSDALPRHHSAPAIAAPPPPRDSYVVSGMSVSLLSVTPIVGGQ